LTVIVTWPDSSNSCCFSFIYVQSSYKIRKYWYFSGK